MRTSRLLLVLVWMIILVFVIVLIAGCSTYTCPTYADGEPIEQQAPVPEYSIYFVARGENLPPLAPVDSGFNTKRPSVGYQVKTMFNNKVPVPLMMLGASVGIIILRSIYNIRPQ